MQLGSLDPRSNGTGLLNLSATVTPSNFAQRFGQLFNTWVALGYCPQCSPGMVVGNGTDNLVNLPQQYRQSNSTLSSLGESHFTVNWAWEAAILTLSLTLLIASITAIVLEYGKSGILSAYGRRRAKNFGNDQDSMRMLLSPVQATIPEDRYPMPRRPVSHGRARESLTQARNMRKRISARLSKMSGASFTLPIQGARVQSAAEEPASEARSSAEFFTRRYSNIPEGRYPTPRRSLSEDPGNRRSAVSTTSKHIPSVRYSVFPNTLYAPAQQGGFDKIPDEDPSGGTTRKEKLLSVRYSNVPPFRYRGPQQQESPAAVSPSDGPSWIYDEYMSRS